MGKANVQAGRALTVRLDNRGNADFGQDARRRLPGTVGPLLVAVANFAAASAACREYIATHGLGGGNWTGGEVYRGRVLVGRVSYNGKVWPPEEWRPEMEPLYVP